MTHFYFIERPDRKEFACCDPDTFEDVANEETACFNIDIESDDE